MFPSIIFYLFFFLFNDVILDKHGWKGIYFLMHAIQNVAIGIFTFPSVKRILFQPNDISLNSLLSPSVGGLVYALHIYHILLYYHQINTPEKIHHIVSLGIVIPLSHLFFSNHDLLALSLFATTGWASTIHYLALFFYKNTMFSLKKRDVLYIGHLSNTYFRYPLIISNASFLLQYLTSSVESLSMSQLSSGCLLLCILLWNGYYFRYLVEKSYYSAVVSERCSNVI